jgi:hypothetical protein
MNKVRKALEEKKQIHENDPDMIRSLNEEIAGVGYFDGMFDTYLFDTDEKAIEYYYNKAKVRTEK